MSVGITLWEHMAGALGETDPPFTGVNLREFVIFHEGIVMRRIEGVIFALLPNGEDHCLLFFGIRMPPLVMHVVARVVWSRQ